MFKTILAATDLVNRQDSSVGMAAALAAENDSQLFILHVLESASTLDRSLVKHYQTGEDIQSDRNYREEVASKLQDVNKAVIDEVPTSHIQVATGYPWKEILRRAHQISADLITMGPHSSRAYQKGVVRIVGQVGSTVEGVITREKCPVMIVNPRLSNPAGRFNRILLGVDFSAACECALCFAGRLGRFFNAKVFVFHMIPIPPYPKYVRKNYQADRESAQERLTYFCREYLEQTDWVYHIKGGAMPHTELLAQAQKVNADLIVLGSHTRQSQGKWYPGSSVERVSYRSNCPVMVINTPEALRPWKDMQTSLAKAKRPKDRYIHVFTGKT
jgi:nucleotide-binding universal stress UspA family protein